MLASHSMFLFQVYIQVPIADMIANCTCYSG